VDQDHRDAIYNSPVPGAPHIPLEPIGTISEVGWMEGRDDQTINLLLQRANRVARTTEMLNSFIRQPPKEQTTYEPIQEDWIC